MYMCVLTTTHCYLFWENVIYIYKHSVIRGVQIVIRSVQIVIRGVQIVKEK